MKGKLEFRDSENPWSPIDTIAQINARTGADLELIGLDDQTGGTSSAAYARHRATTVEFAITRTTTSLPDMILTAEVLEIARSAGCLVPRHVETVAMSDGYVAIVQERLPGRRPARVDAAAVDAMVAANELFARMLSGRLDVPPPPAFAAATSSPWNATLGSYNRRSQRLLTRNRERLQPMGGDDLVHLDYTLGNVLYHDQHRVSGIVDWNRGIARGDRWYALIGTHVNMTSEAALYGVTGDAIDRLDEILTTHLDDPTRARYREHWYLDSAHRSILSRFPAARIEQDLDLAEQHQT